MSKKRGMTLDEMSKAVLDDENYALLQQELEEDKEITKIWAMLLPRRKELGLTQEQVAKRMGPGITQSMVSDLETKAKRLDFDNITYKMTQKYAHALGLHVQLGLVIH